MRHPRRVFTRETLLTKIKTANPDVLVAVNYYQDGVLLARQIAKLRIPFKAIFFATGPDLPETWVEDLGDSGDYYFGAEVYSAFRFYASLSTELDALCTLLDIEVVSLKSARV